MIVNGRKIADKIFSKLQTELKILNNHNIHPKLGVVLVGNNQSSKLYVKKKAEACQKIGIDFLLKQYKENIKEEDLIAEIKNLQKKEDLDGLIVQLPLPKHINAYQVIKYIKPEIDVDCLTEVNLGKLIIGNYKIIPPTPAAILEILKYHQVEIKGKRVVLIGSGVLIGRPLANLLFHLGATLTICNSFTKKLKEITKTADILISGVGKHNLISKDMLKRKAIVIDAGICFINQKLYGDVDFDQIKNKVSLLTPTPGGVGPLTVVKLIENTINCAQRKI